MFERDDNTERFFIETIGWDEGAIKSGLAWLLRYSLEREHPQAAISVGIKDQVRQMAPALPKQLADALYKSGSAQVDGITLSLILDRRMPFDFTEGPVLAMWAGDKRLEKLDGLRAPAICAITWSEGNIDNWKAAWGPIDLRSGGRTQAAGISNRVVEIALEGLTASVNLGTGLGHPSDRDMAVNTFRVLKANNEQYEPDEIRAWAARHGWAAEYATELGEVAAKIAEGRRLRSEQVLRDDVIKHWRDEAAGAGDD